MKRIIGICEDGGIRMPYARIGEGKKNLVILPGLSMRPVSGAAAAVARQYRKFLENDYTLWLVDRRENIPENYTFAQMAEDTVKVLKALGVEKAEIFGASQGGMLALTMACTDPAFTEKIALGSSAGRKSKQISERLAVWDRLTEKKDSRGLAETFVDWMFGEKTLAAARRFLLAETPEYTEEEWRRFRRLLRTFDTLEVWDRTESCTCPVLILGCEGDQVIGPEASRELADKLHAELIMYGSEYGHAVYDEAPDYPEQLFRFFS